MVFSHHLRIEYIHQIFFPCPCFGVHDLRWRFPKWSLKFTHFIHFTLSGLLNLILPGGAAGPEYLASDYFQRAWLPFRCSAFRFGSMKLGAALFNYGILECLKKMKGHWVIVILSYLFSLDVFRCLFVTGLVELQRECTCPIPHHTCQDTAHQLQLVLPFAWHMATWLQVQLRWIYLVVMTCSILFNHGHK